MIKAVLIFSAVLIGLISCTTSQHVIIVSTYSSSPISYQKMDNKDEWTELWPIVNLKDGLLVKIHPDSWESLTDGNKSCSKSQNKFFVQFWSNADTIIDFEKSYFVTEKEDTVAIKSVLIQEQKKGYSSNNDDSLLVKLKKTKLANNEIMSLWENNNYKELRDKSGALNLTIETVEFVGCARDKFKFFVSFNHGDSDAQLGHWLYFAPVEFKAFSR